MGTVVGTVVGTIVGTTVGAIVGSIRPPVGTDEKFEKCDFQPMFRDRRKATNIFW